MSSKAGEKHYPYIPLEDRYLVKRHTSATVSPGGILLPETTQLKSTRGTIVAKGPGVDTGNVKITMVLEVGDVVLFGQYMGNEIPEEGDVILLKQHEILAKVDE
jgi:chaperonin GroES